jgi:hypothetical protein
MPNKTRKKKKVKVPPRKTPINKEITSKEAVSYLKKALQIVDRANKKTALRILFSDKNCVLGGMGLYVQLYKIPDWKELVEKVNEVFNSAIAQYGLPEKFPYGLREDGANRERTSYIDFELKNSEGQKEILGLLSNRKIAKAIFSRNIIEGNKEKLLQYLERLKNRLEITMDFLLEIPNAREAMFSGLELYDSSSAVLRPNMYDVISEVRRYIQLIKKE